MPTSETTEVTPASFDSTDWIAVSAQVGRKDHQTVAERHFLHLPDVPAELASSLNLSEASGWGAVHFKIVL